MALKVKGIDDSEVDLESIVQGMIAKNNGNPTDALTNLVSENYGLRQKNRELREKAEGAVPEGHKVVSPEDFVLLTSYKELGKPDELKTKLTTGSQAEEKVTELTRGALVRDAAELHGLKGSILSDLVRLNGLNIEISSREVPKQDGTKAVEKLAVVKQSDGSTKTLQEVLEGNYPEYLPALKTSQGDRQVEGGTPWVQQAKQPEGTPKSETSKAASDYIKNQYGEPAK